MLFIFQTKTSSTFAGCSFLMLGFAAFPLSLLIYILGYYWPFLLPSSIVVSKEFFKQDIVENLIKVRVCLKSKRNIKVFLEEPLEWVPDITFGLRKSFQQNLSDGFQIRPLLYERFLRRTPCVDSFIGGSVENLSQMVAHTVLYVGFYVGLS